MTSGATHFPVKGRTLRFGRKSDLRWRPVGPVINRRQFHLFSKVSFKQFLGLQKTFLSHPNRFCLADRIGYISFFVKPIHGVPVKSLPCPCTQTLLSFMGHQIEKCQRIFIYFIFVVVHSSSCERTAQREPDCFGDPEDQLVRQALDSIILEWSVSLFIIRDGLSHRLLLSLRVSMFLENLDDNENKHEKK